MAGVYSLYLDDSGTRAPDHVVPTEPTSNDWFALGGIVFCDDDKDAIEKAHSDFYARWPILKDLPLHSSDIRASKKHFSFLSRDKETRSAFLNDLGTVMTSLPVLAHGCVIDRYGYRTRYAEKYGAEKWLYCKTAFKILVERAAKFARSKGARLRVCVERTNKATDDLISEYYASLSETGMPFNEDTSDRYGPLDAAAFRETLYELSMKTKKSRAMQFADIFLFPLCKAAYADDRTYVALRDNRRLIDTILGEEDIAALGVKYSCFDQAPPFARRPKD